MEKFDKRINYANPSLQDLSLKNLRPPQLCCSGWGQKTKRKRVPDQLWRASQKIQENFTLNE